ncbi:MAG: hypothetical protein SFU86_07045 [Pirellulaceae bacterium]|nr:hypothetical protein [Pirellulaceae bacterium]
MPATESTWRHMPLMHRVFAISGVVLTVATLWMFYKDHTRPWKTIQPQVVNIDLAMNRWRQEQYETSTATLQHERLSLALAQAKAQPLDATLLADFSSAVETDRTDARQLASIQARNDQLKSLSAEAATLRSEATAALATADKKPEDAPLRSAARAADEKAAKAEAKAAAARTALVGQLQNLVIAAKNREDKVLDDRKAVSGKIDAAKAQYDIAIRDNLGEAELARRQEAINALVGAIGKSGTFNDLNETYQQLSAHRRKIESVLKGLNERVDAAQKAHDDSLANLERLRTQARQQYESYFVGSFPFLGKKILTLPILDAFSSPRKIDNLWSDGLLQDYSHARVRRFDRCTTCHQSITKTLPGMPTTPAYPGEQDHELVLVPPAAGETPKPRLDRLGNELPITLEDWLGIRLADAGLLDADDVTVSLVLPNTPAARANFVRAPSADDKQTGLELREASAQLTELPGSARNPFPTLPGLAVGDVITSINGSDLFGGDRSPKRVSAMLLALAQEGKPIRLGVRRGLPNPYTSHPRLDLFVGDSSPHKLQTFACTVCHEGQGSATEFKWASHTPNNPIDAARWSAEHGWFDNAHWIFPMLPQRFSESSCLKCHHEVVELEPSERFPDPPAPKLVHGYHLIRKYGCYGCHEVNGYDGPTRRIGPDLRSEPNYFASAQSLRTLLPARDSLLTGKLASLSQKVKDLNDQISKADPAQAEATAAMQKELVAAQGQMAEAQRLLENVIRASRLAATLVNHPELVDPRHELLGILNDDVKLAQDAGDAPASESALTAFDAKAHAMAGWFKDQEAPGSLRRSGPSLRYVGAKLDREFLYDWINDPQSFRQSTRMPRFFGLWDHLKDADGHMHDEAAPKLEPIEIRGMIEYLTHYSQDRAKVLTGPSPDDLAAAYSPLPRPAGIDKWTDDEKVARGKIAFQTRGCLACHTHQDFPDVSKFRPAEEIVQGPDLSAVGTKFGAERNPAGPDWLYSWIKEPTRYHVRTVMPNLYLDPDMIPGPDAAKPKDGAKWFDPADDIATYLLKSSTSNWKPVAAAATATKPLDGDGRKALETLMSEYLNEAFYRDAAADYLLNGIPPEIEGELKGAEKDLIVDPAKKPTAAAWETQQLRYIGRKSISKYGCFGCHDIPGFEDAKPIGTGLADWGRKDPAKLAFEHITHYIEHGHGHAGHGGHDKSSDHESPAQAEAEAEEDTPAGETVAFFKSALEASNRIGFIYQKLKEPRSYDYDKTENKRYNERLRMPQFPFSVEEREAVVTFVLGLVADPPREKYIFTPNPRTRALVAGKQVLEKYNCGGCHILEVEKWQISYGPGEFGPQAEAKILPFMRPQISPQALAAQAIPDHRNLLHSSAHGMPNLKKEDGLPVIKDADGLDLEDDANYRPSEIRQAVDLFQPTIFDGNLYLTGQSPVSAGANQLDARYPTWGGVLTRYLTREVTRLERQVNSNASGAEALGWLPPPLIGEGHKVQSAWLHDFLLEPYTIRPATFLRMPKFNMTSGEATALVNYFSAVDNAEFPYEFTPQRLESELAARAVEYGKLLDEAGVAAPGGKWASEPTEALIARRFEDAMKIVVDANYCVKCHKVSDFSPTGSNRGKAPNLADVYRRLRPAYVRDWIANPKMILPYTSMPVQFAYDPTLPFEGTAVNQNLFHGTGTQQIDGLVDLLMNFDQYSRQNRKIAELVKPAAPPAAAETTPATSSGGP